MLVTKRLFRATKHWRFHSHWIQCVGSLNNADLKGLFSESTVLQFAVSQHYFCSKIQTNNLFLTKEGDSQILQTHEEGCRPDFGLVVFLCVPQCPHYVTHPQGLTWAGVVFSCIGGCVRGGGGHPLVWTHGILARRRAGLSRLLVCQVQWGAFLGGQQWSSWPGCGVDLQPGLDFIFHNLSVVSSCHPALVQSFIVLAHSGDLQLVWDVVALDFHRLLQ